MRMLTRRPLARSADMHTMRGRIDTHSTHIEHAHDTYTDTCEKLANKWENREVEKKVRPLHAPSCNAV